MTPYLCAVGRSSTVARRPRGAVGSGRRLLLLEATGHLSKGDSIDAQVLAPFPATIRAAVHPLPDAQQQGLGALRLRRRLAGPAPTTDTSQPDLAGLFAALAALSPEELAAVLRSVGKPA